MLEVLVLLLSIRGSDAILIAILLTRVYALWDRNRIILWSLLFYYFGFAGFAGVRYPSRSAIPFSIRRFLVGDYPRKVRTPSFGATNFTGMYRLFVEG